MEITKEFDARNAEKSRAVCKAMAERADTSKRILSEREKLILDMWPKFEDGEPVMIGDGVDSLGGEIIEVYIAENAVAIWNNFGNHMHLSLGERVKRAVQSVPDADGTEIEVGDTVYEPNGKRGIVIAVHPSSGCVDLWQDGCDAYAMDAQRLTHTRPDSWGRLEEDAEKLACAYYGRSQCACFGCPMEDCVDFYACSREQAKDIVRRAKALAGAEACR